jgi:phytanoyl-CoA hydroxylase
MKPKIFKVNKSKIFLKEYKDYYDKNGYIILRNLFSKKEMDHLDKSISKYADSGWHNIMNPDRIEFLISQCHKKFLKKNGLLDKINYVSDLIETSDLFRAYLKDKRVVKILEKLKKKKFVGLMTHVIFKHAKSKYAKLGWVPHQDNSYAKMKNGSYITTNLFLHSANKDNGCLYLYPGSHKIGLVDSKSYYSYNASSSQKPGNRVKYDLNQFHKIDLQINKGDFLVMSGNLIHGSYGNYSKKLSRHMLSFNYGVKGEKFSPGITAKRKSISLT